jgi:hypothetical protein
MNAVQRMAEMAEIVERGEYAYYGVRVENGRILSAGDVAPVSRRWDDGNPTDEEEDGTCAISLRKLDVGAALNRLAIYNGDRIVLLGGHYFQRGEDRDEAILRDAVVLFEASRSEVQ